MQAWGPAQSAPLRCSQESAQQSAACQHVPAWAWPAPLMAPPSCAGVEPGERGAHARQASVCGGAGAGVRPRRARDRRDLVPQVRLQPQAWHCAALAELRPPLPLPPPLPRVLQPGEAGLTSDEQSLLDRICDAYWLPAWCSLADYERLFREQGFTGGELWGARLWLFRGAGPGR